MQKKRGTVLRKAGDGDTGLTINVKQSSYNKIPYKGQLAVVRVWVGTCKVPILLGGYCNRQDGSTVYITDCPDWIKFHLSEFGQMAYTKATIDFVL